MLRLSCAWIAIAITGACAAPRSDWLLRAPEARTTIEASPDGREVSLGNGLIRRTWRLKPDCATAAFENLMTGASIIRGVKPEAILTLDGTETPVGGLLGQPDYGYLRAQWLDTMTADPKALHCTGWERAPVVQRFGWKRVRYAAAEQWPPAGAGIVFHFGAPAGLRVDVHYEMYDGVPVLAKWLTLHNKTTRGVRLNHFISELLAVVEEESAVEDAPRPPQLLYVESDYAFGGRGDRTTVWAPDPQYTSQVNYRRLSPVLLESRPPIGPNVALAAGGTFETSARSFSRWTRPIASAPRSPGAACTARLLRGPPKIRSSCMRAEAIRMP